MTEILLVEDCIEIHQIVLRSVVPQTHVHWAQSLTQAQKMIIEKNFDLFIIDLGLPDGSGMDLCRHVHERTPTTPIFILTGHSDLSNKMQGFSAGADHYITKPICPQELGVRIQSCLQKNKARTTLSDTLEWREIQINKLSQAVNVIEKGKWVRIDLTSLEFKILLYLSSRIGEVIMREDILKFVWGQNIHVSHRSVDTHVSKLRKKMGSASLLIESIHRMGYKFSPTPL